MSALFSLTGKVILITGSTRGLGWSMAQACAQHGATTIVHGRGTEAAETRAQELAAKGHSSDFLAFEMEDRQAVEAAVPTILERHGSVWGIINNAGMLLHEELLNDSADNYERLLSVHLIAPFVLTKAAAAAMVQNPGDDRGRIVNIASIAVTSPRVGIGNYTSAKGAIVGFTRSMGADLGRHGIRCNTIAPGYFVTDINRERLDDKAFADKVNNRTPAGRWGDPDELGGPAVFLMSAASSYVNSQLIYVDGGMSHFLHAV